ncbi:MAG: hypothetical protein KDJ54_00930 [Candidatus Competibacteraceae bacterium]|nr:hypothetical protein [Candidatus Competibacteraceae bacterium]
MNPAAVEVAFRGHAAVLAGPSDGLTGVALDGKTLRGGFDRFQDQKTLQVLSALTTDQDVDPGACSWIGAAGKSHEIPVAQQLINELGLSRRLFTLDALHGQRNKRRTVLGYNQRLNNDFNFSYWNGFTK